jgi:PAS domain S-box-containing protein
MLEGIVIFAGAGHSASANDSLCHMLGRSRDELIGEPADPYFGELAACMLPGGKCAAVGERREGELKGREGNSVVVEYSMQRIEDGQGRFLGCFGMLTDITARANARAALRRSENDLRLLSAQLWAAQELERKRIARELHDGIGQALGGIKFSMENCAALLRAGSGKAALDNIHQLARKIKDVLEELRRISMNLRPSTLDDLGILATIGWFSREFRGIYRQVRLETVVEVEEDEISPEVKTAIYRIIQEAVHNVVEHSGASAIWLTMSKAGDRVELRVRDDGVGFDLQQIPRGGSRGLGLTSMRERAESTGGRFRMESQPGAGTTILITWPIQQAKTQDVMALAGG